MCANTSTQYILPNVTRLSDLPQAQFNFVALVPWISPSCTKSFLAASQDAAAMVVYLPDNQTVTPPPISDPIWKLDDGGSWKRDNKFPVYAIPGSAGAILMHELNSCPKNLTSAVDQSLLPTTYAPSDSFRLCTSITLSNQSSLPNMWEFLLIVLGIVILIVLITSASMHCIQRRKRRALRQRVLNGEVDLEALGIKKLTVPSDAIKKLPLFIFISETDERSSADGPSLSKQSTEITSKGPKLPIPSLKPRCVSEPPGVIGSRGTVLPSERESEVSTLAHPDPSLPHQKSKFSEVSCSICIDDFDHNHSVVRELPCGHIYHHGCIDRFLTKNSSRCPNCKAKVLPHGYCPEITNVMVRRERLSRRQQRREMPTRAREEASGAGRPMAFGGRMMSFHREFGRSARTNPGERRISSAPAGPVALEMGDRVADSNNHLGTTQAPLNPMPDNRGTSIQIGQADDTDQGHERSTCKFVPLVS